MPVPEIAASTRVFAGCCAREIPDDLGQAEHPHRHYRDSDTVGQLDNAKGEA